MSVCVCLVCLALVYSTWLSLHPLTCEFVMDKPTKSSPWCRRESPRAPLAHQPIVRSFDQPVLVGGIPSPLKKYYIVSWDHYSQYMEKIKFVFQTTNQSSINKNTCFATRACESDMALSEKKVPSKSHGLLWSSHLKWLFWGIPAYWHIAYA